MAFRKHAIEHDADGFWIAERGGQPIGFGIATARPGFWHLNALHVLPEFQAAGVGSQLLRHCLDYGEGRDAGTVSTVISEAAQPVSNAMYARAGMYQWVPLIHVDCPVFESSPPPALGQSLALDSTTLGALDDIDTSVLGFTRRVDHKFWGALPDVALELLWLRGSPVGYTYVSSFGGIGPCAVRSVRHFPALLARGIQRARALGLERVSFVVPGLATAALAFLLQRSARYEADTTLLLSSRPFGHLDRYVSPPATPCSEVRPNASSTMSKTVQRGA